MKIVGWWGVWNHPSEGGALLVAIFKDGSKARRWAMSQYGAERYWTLAKAKAEDVEFPDLERR